ncbi:MAG: aminopeptidase P family protein [Archangiaceae bacterium]|nr:aminopeptidase P family protein [Archangiaceae bacterium]
MTYLTEKQAQKNAYDTTAPEALKKFMTSQWKPRAKKVVPLKNAAVHAARRAQLSKLFEGQALLIPTGHEKIRANDTVYRFRPGSDFFWLTGNLEPDCVLLMQPLARGGHRAVLFVEPNPGKSDETFFTDRKKGELWVGPRLGVDESRVRFGVDEARPLSALAGAVKGALVLRGLSADLEALAKEASPRDAELATQLAELRLYKDPVEVAELKKAIDSTQRGFEDVIRGLKRFDSEREVEGTFFLRARTEGHDVGYGTIAASGQHACTLHWTHNDGKLEKSDLLLLDAGVEGHSLYTADITRTLPISGRFSRAQREVYELVHRAQAAAFTGVKPGNDFMEPNRRAMRVLTRGLVELGILKCTVGEALDEQHLFYKRYTLHNVSHMLGLDVHDCAKARQESYKLGKLKPGMVLTVEPGLYFQDDDLTVPAKYRGIGVRIEDDVLVTAKGMLNLSRSIPSQADDVERWMKRVGR